MSCCAVLCSAVASPTCPVAVCAVCIREEVVRLDRPADVAVAGLGSNVGSRRGVQHIHTAISIHIVDQPAAAAAAAAVAGKSALNGDLVLISGSSQVIILTLES